jgi:hypothetical protein
VPKLRIQTDVPWKIYIELDGPIYVTIAGQRVQLRTGNDGWDVMHQEAGDV